MLSDDKLSQSNDKLSHTKINNSSEHLKEILNNIPKQDFQLVRVFKKNKHKTDWAFSDGVVVVKNNKLAGRLEDIKLLESLEPESRKKFLSEGKILSAMNHKNIPKVYDILDHEDWLLFRYEHVDGYSLREVLDYLKKKKKTFPKIVATTITLKILNALFYAHNEVRYDGKKKSIIHCDVKPSNIILCAKDYSRKGNLDNDFIALLNENKVEPFLIDFGIAKFQGKSSMDGTIGYLSPDQIRKTALDWRTDVYQALLVYHEMLTLITPYEGLSKNKVLDEKINHDFTIDKKINSNNQIKDFIAKGTKKDPSNSFKSEKDCIRTLSHIECAQKKFEFVRKWKKPITITAIILFFLVTSFVVYVIWDNNTNSIDAIIRGIENNPDPTIEELEDAMHRIQKRGFEKKYYKPLLNGEFRDAKTGKPLYPSHLDTEGNWVLVGPEREEAGAFVGLLFNYSDRYPKLLPYAKEYAEPILENDFDGIVSKRYIYALIPAYEATHDEIYLKKMINISEVTIYYLNMQEGSTQCDDLYYGKLFLYLYTKTGQQRYLDFYAHYIRTFIRNNIDADGYIYEYASVNATSIYGPIMDNKMGRLVTPLITSETHPIGNFLMLSSTDKIVFKNITSPFSDDFVEALTELYSMYILTNSRVYYDAYERSFRYYKERLPKDSTDYLFISYLNTENNIPKNSITTIKSLYLLKKIDSDLYKDKLRSFLTSEYFRDDDEKSLLRGGVLIDTIVYEHSDETKKNQTLLESDALFLELE